MGIVIPVCLAEFMGVKMMAAVALGLIAYLYWLGFREKRLRRRQQREAEQRRLSKTPACPGSDSMAFKSDHELRVLTLFAWVVAAPVLCFVAYLLWRKFGPRRLHRRHRSRLRRCRAARSSAAS